MSGVTTSSLSLAWSLRNWVILDYEEANGLTIRPWAPFLLGRWLTSSKTQDLRTHLPQVSTKIKTLWPGPEGEILKVWHGKLPVDKEKDKQRQLSAPNIMPLDITRETTLKRVLVSTVNSPGHVVPLSLSFSCLHNSPQRKTMSYEDMRLNVYERKRKG